MRSKTVPFLSTTESVPTDAAIALENGESDGSEKSSNLPTSERQRAQETADNMLQQLQTNGPESAVGPCVRRCSAPRAGDDKRRPRIGTYAHWLFAYAHTQYGMSSHESSSPAM